MNYHIIDTTLREGEQTPGVLFSLAEKKAIIDRLVRAGIQEAEIGIASPLSTCIPPLTEYCRRVHPGLTIALWCRCNIADIDYAARLQPDILALSIPASDIHIQNKLGKDRDWVLATLQKSVRYARKHGLKVAVGCEDATRADSSFLQELADVAREAGAFRLRLADTVGIASPATIVQLVLAIREAVPNLAVGVHTHNDFGMATGNAIAALEAGAHSADGVVLGLGERTGCAPLEELIGYLSLIKTAPRFAVEELKPLAQFVSSLAKRTIPANRPLIGEAIFSCESGLHVHGLLSDPRTYEPFAPEKVGASRRVYIGAKIGRSALALRLQELGIADSQTEANRVIASVRRMATELDRPLTDEDLLALVGQA